MEKGIHPTTISDAFMKAAVKSIEILEKMAIPLDLSDRQSLLKSATTSLSSKTVSQYGNLAPIAVDAVLKVIDPAKDHDVDLHDIKGKIYI
jgi:T-complex protein 1 subunit delta